jgi:hypothetical protein
MRGEAFNNRPPCERFSREQCACIFDKHDLTAARIWLLSPRMIEQTGISRTRLWFAANHRHANSTGGTVLCQGIDLRKRSGTYDGIQRVILHPDVTVKRIAPVHLLLR